MFFFFAFPWKSLILEVTSLVYVGFWRWRWTTYGRYPPRCKRCARFCLIGRLAQIMVFCPRWVSKYRVKSQNILCSVHSQGKLRLKAMPTPCARCMRAAKYLTSYLVRPLHVTTMRSNSSNYLDVSRPRLAKRSHLPSTLQGQQIVVIMISWLILSSSLRNIRITDSNMCS